MLFVMNVVKLGACVLSLCFFSNVAVGSEWSYTGEDGPSEWYEDAPKCAGQYQSPVDITENNALIDPSLTMLEFTGYGQTLGGMFINDGHSVKLNFPANKTFKLSGGGMSDNTYTALQLHFHWAVPGSNNGSEHTINGTHYPVEMHIVHIKDPHTSVSQVKDMADGLAVLGVFLDVGAEGNMAYENLFNVAKDCTYKDMQVALEDGPRLLSLLPDSGSYYRYSGSLTTPPCYQTVTWTVLREPVIISQQQLEMLQSLKSSSMGEAAKDSHGENACVGEDCENRKKRALDSGDADDNLSGNFRPVQPLNGRIVTSYLDWGFAVPQGGHGWTYHNPLTGTSKWTKTYPICGQNRQSPINVDTSNLESPETDDIGLAFKGYDDKLRGSFSNDGHTVRLDFDKSLDYVISGGGLNSSYKALQLHFHWGEVSSDGNIEGGSEHTVNNVRYPAEMHIVHEKTSDLPNLSSPDSFAVLGAFIDVSKSDSGRDNNDGFNADMQSLFNAINKVKFSGDKTGFPQGPTLQALLPEDKSFYRYDGSLTTPPCSETVIWTVFSKPIVISLNQFVAFQQLFCAEASQREDQNSIKREMTLAEGTSSRRKRADTEDEETLADNTGNERRDSLLSASRGSLVTVDLYNTTEKHLLRNNYRPIQELNRRTVYYYDLTAPSTTAKPVDPTGLPVWEIVLFSVGGIIVFVVFIAIVMRCCCNRKKNAGYSAGRKDTEDAANL